MNPLIVDANDPVLLVGGGAHRKSGLRAAEGRYGRVVAADGGADWLLGRGILPDAVIGDLDSVSAEALAAIPAERIHKIAEQDSTDFEKCLMRISAPMLLCAGFLGGRADHALAAFHGLAAVPERRAVLIGKHDIAFLAPPECDLALKAGTRVSLFPLAPMRAESRGLRWEVGDVRFDPLRKIGTSNEALGDVSLKVSAPAMLVILPQRELPAVLAALLGRHGGAWTPRRA